MMSNPSYSDDIGAISTVLEEEKLILLGSEYQYELHIDKYIGHILETMPVSSLEIIVVNNPPSLKLDNSIKMKFLISYPLKSLSKDMIHSLKKVGFFTYENVVADPDGIMIKFERIVKRSEKDTTLIYKQVTKSSKFIVYEEPTKGREIIATILKPITFIIDMFILVIGLILYSFQT